MNTTLVMAFFLVKHLVVDFFLQGPFQYLNKGKYGHVGGILHASIHGLVSFAFLAFLNYVLNYPVSMTLIWCLCFGEAVIHYHMDWFKIWWCAKKNYRPHTDLDCTLRQAHWFWWWVGIDQTVHLMTYLWMSWMLIT